MPRHDELVYAASSGDLATVKRLVEAGAEPTFHPQVTWYLLKHGADPTIRDANRDTPLSWASWHLRDKSVIDQLWYNGAGVGPDFPPLAKHTPVDLSLL